MFVVEIDDDGGPLLRVRAGANVAAVGQLRRLGPAGPCGCDRATSQRRASPGLRSIERAVSLEKGGQSRLLTRNRDCDSLRKCREGCSVRGLCLGCEKIGFFAIVVYAYFCSVSSMCIFAPKGQPFSQPWATPRVARTTAGDFRPNGPIIRPRGTVGPLGRHKNVAPPLPWALPRAGRTAGPSARRASPPTEQNRP